MSDDCIEATLKDLEVKEAALREIEKMGDFRVPLKRFAAICELRMRAHDETRGTRSWKADPVNQLFARLYDELEEVLSEWMGERNDDPVAHFLIHQLRTRARQFYCKPPQYEVKRLTDELADVANFCMMIADAAGGLDE